MSTPDVGRMVAQVKAARDSGQLQPIAARLEQRVADAEIHYHRVRDWRGKNGQELAPEVIGEAHHRLVTLRTMLALCRPKPPQEEA